jgi:hypothetical protein
MNFMEKRIILLLAFVMLIGFVSAADGWGEFTDGEADPDVEETAVSDEEDEGPSIQDTNTDSGITAGETASSSEGSMEKTQDFYIALGIGGGALLIFLLLLYLLLKKPRNRWKKK